MTNNEFDFKTLCLDQTVVLPENYREIVTKHYGTSTYMQELHYCAGCYGNDGRHFIYKETGPFTVRIIESDAPSAKSGDLYYQVEFHVDNPAFAPFLKFIKEWGKKNCRKGAKLNECFWYWLEGQCDFSPENDYDVDVDVPCNNSSVTCIVKSETDLYKLLKDLSKGFRILATEHASESADIAQMLDYDTSELKGKSYRYMANNILTPMVLRGLIEGLAAYRKSGGTDDPNISIEVKKKAKTMLFFHGDNCKGEPFHTFEIGAVLTKCLTGIRDEGLEYEAELSHWFTDAAHNLPEKAVEGLRVCIEVPETGGDPVFEN